jgi:hypothetical protein
MKPSSNLKSVEKPKRKELKFEDKIFREAIELSLAKFNIKFCRFQDLRNPNFYCRTGERAQFEINGLYYCRTHKKTMERRANKSKSKSKPESRVKNADKRCPHPDLSGIDPNVLLEDD